MAQANAWQPLYEALAKYGVAVLDKDKAALEHWIEPLADSDANAVISAIASHIALSGLAAMLDGSIKNALVESEPQIDTVINQNINGGIDSLDSLLSGIAAG